jgi:uncharacterized protein
MQAIHQKIADELNVRAQQVAAAIELLDGGATVPFISRYRKEVTQGLDDTQLRNLEERLHYLRELNERRDTVLNSIREQGKLTPELERDIVDADSKTRLEDLYASFKPKRRTKGQIAKEAGLEPLADALFSDRQLQPEQIAANYINADLGVADVAAALEGARYILMERFAEDAQLLQTLRTYVGERAEFEVKVVPGKEQEAEKFRDYFDYHEALSKIPSHRILAVLRGRNEGLLSVKVALPGLDDRVAHPCETLIAQQFAIGNQHPADKFLQETVRWTWKVKLAMQLEMEWISQLREQADIGAIDVFARNLRALLMAAPAGPRATLGLDPGLRTGVKVVVISATGNVLDHTAIYPHAPKNQWRESIELLAQWCRRYQIELISIGNGTASRETDKLVSDLLKAHSDIKAQKMVVSEAGASVYSASAFAAAEFPDLDVTLRGAVSIARRLQDPLAELVKIDPKSIGVGQYQHDVNQTKLARSLDAVVEDCVNAVGVDVNTASVALLARIAGLTQTLAQNLVEHRSQHGPFRNREQLKKVPRLGAKTFEQAAGFLRVVQGDNRLDASAVHPEAYELVASIAKRHARSVDSLLGDRDFISQLKPQDYVTEQFGLISVTDILQELAKPARDPRGEFRAVVFRDGIDALKDLQVGMVLEGVVTNVANFGAFVDVGVHQDGLVHVSALSHSFVKDPHQVVKAGDIVKVKVLEVDVARKRIALTMRLEDAAKPAEANSQPRSSKPFSAKSPLATQPPAPKNSLSQAFAKAGLK